MNVHFNSPCKQCYYFNICSKNNKNIRSSKIKTWKENGGFIGMSITDCFKSPEEHERDFNNLPEWKKEKIVEIMKLPCWGTYDRDEGFIKCCKCHGLNECAIISKVKRK